MQIPPVAVLIRHRVTDYDTWKRAFDDHQDARREATCLGHHVNRGVDDPNLLTVYCPATNADRVKAFIDSPDLADKMQTAGVVGPPSITFMIPKSADFLPDRELAAMIVVHDVADYDRWRAAYDDFDAHRKASGIVGHAVNQELGNPRRVIVYHQARDVDTLRRFVDSPELAERMQQAGVQGPPEIEFVDIADIATY